MILLDTHVLLWAISKPDAIGPNTWQQLNDPSTAVRYSAVSITEIRIKEMLGRMTAPADLLTQITAAGFDALPYSEHDADAITQLPQLVRHDPFDRMILGQAAARAADLYTTDRRLVSLGLPYVFDCRE